MALVRSHVVILNEAMNGNGKAWPNLFVDKQDLECFGGRWHCNDIHHSHLMRTLARVIVVLMQHLLLGGSRAGGVDEGTFREIFSLAIDSDTLISMVAERVS